MIQGSGVNSFRRFFACDLREFPRELILISLNQAGPKPEDCFALIFCDLIQNAAITNLASSFVSGL